MIDQLRLVLVSPKYSGNVGAVARVATNFDVRDLAVVNPQCDISDEQAKLYGKGPARETLLGINQTDSLTEAIQDCALAVAFTRRHGDWSPTQISLKDLPDFIQTKTHESGRKVALVFGREDQCLSREEQLKCSHYCTIPASPSMPTMNLSHSVAAVLSRIYADWNGVHVDHEFPKAERMASIQDFEILMTHFSQTLVDAGITKAGNPERMAGRIRRILQKESLRTRDVDLLRAFLSKVQLKMGSKNK